MKRLYIKLFFVALLLGGVFVYGYFNSVHDGDIFRGVEQKIQQRLSAQPGLTFKNMRIAQRETHSKGEAVRVCGDFQLPNVVKLTPFAVTVNITDTEFTVSDQMIIAENSFTETAISKLCTKK
nr:hypothetical protein [uncultured Moellerella sp.]